MCLVPGVVFHCTQCLKGFSEHNYDVPCLPVLVMHNSAFISFQDMTHVFEKAQESESKRLMFFKEMLFATHKCLNISNDARYDEVCVCGRRQRQPVKISSF